jgi:hypothetical protein
MLAFVAALVSIPHEPYVGMLFVLACSQFCVALTLFAFEVVLSLPSSEFEQ